MEIEYRNIFLVDLSGWKQSQLNFNTGKGQCVHLGGGWMMVDEWI